jgi:predicted nucleotidyltransferase
MKTSLETYRQSREALLAKIVTELSNDERFVAAWLTGSYARNDEDEVSDLDLRLVVAEPYSELLCRRQEQVSHRTTQERFELFSRFGTPALIHENNNNAPEGGTFTFVLYTESAAMIDWILIPLSKAKRIHPSRLLFDKVNAPVSFPEPEEVEQSKKYVAERWAFFWMMTVVTIKYIHRDDGVFAAEWIEYLHGLIHEIERRLNGEPWSYTRGSFSKLQTTREKQLESIRELCNRMQGLKSRVTEFIGSDPATPNSEIDQLFSLAHNANRKSSILNRKPY